jgi:hypothetical protein
LPAKIKDIWRSDPEGIPTLLTDEDKVEYIFYDKDDNPLYNDDGQPATKDDLKPGETYKVRAVINDENNNNYVFESTGTDKTDLKQFTVLFPAELEVPTLENSHLIYNGEEQTVVLIGYESEYMQYDPVELTKIDSNNYVITISIKDGAYAEWADGQPGTEREIAFDIGRAALDCVWEFDGKAPDLASLPDDATVAYIIKDENGNAVNAEHIVEGERYSITAILSDSSSANYYFAESRSDRVVTFFTYRINQKTVSEDSNFEDIFPFWSLLIIVVALVGGGVVWSKVASNIRENSEEKKNSKNNNN